MADTGWDAGAEFYPDIVAEGDASTAWQGEFDRLGIALRARPREGVNPHRTATAVNGERHADLQLNPWQRRFYLALRSDRMTLAQGYPADLATAAQAARLWLSGARPGEVAAAWPFLGSVALAQARERGDRIEARWLWLYENHCADAIGVRLGAFVALAFHEPRLRRLYPYTSHWNLSFSRSPDLPLAREHPVIAPVDAPGRYVVRTRDGRVDEETDAAGALRIVLAQSPDW